MFFRTVSFNPYHGQTFWEVLLEFIKRMRELILGKLAFRELVSDEIQILVLIGVAISSGLLGSFLILRRMTMLANSLSHTILVGIVLAFFFTHFSSYSEEKHVHLVVPMQAMLIAALITGFLTTFLTSF